MARTVVLVVALAGCGRMAFDDQLAPDAGVDAPPTSNVARVTIEHSGAGLGTIVGPNGFVCTGGTCTFEVPPGTSVTLRGLAATNAWFGGWTGVCGGNFDCSFDATTDVTILGEFTPTPNRVFVTSTTTDGAIGGVAAADAICATRATAAGLEGTFVAFLSDVTTNAAARFGSSRGWVRVDGAPFADAPTAFSSGKIWFPPRLDEYGNDLGNVPFYTGTSFGAVSTNRCLDWTSNVGTDTGAMTSTQYAAVSVAAAANRACTTQAHLMCVETGRVIPVAIRPNTGRLAFASRTPWTPGGGRASADALCASEAASIGQSGTFLAAMATTTESIASRFTPGALYRRVDGERLLRAGSVFTADWLDVPPELDQQGGLVIGDLWTGAYRLDAVPTPADNCNDWTDGTSGLDGVMHFTSHTDLRTPAKTDLCSSSVPVLCVEN